MKSNKLFIIIILCFVSCSKDFTKNQYISYPKSSLYGLSNIQQAGSVHITCNYRPIDLLISQAISNITSPSKRVIDSLQHIFTGRTYLMLSFSHNGTEIENRYLPNQQEFTRVVTYLNTGIAQDVCLVTSDPQPDSITALAAIYPRQYGSTGRSTVLLVFDTRRLDLSHGFILSYHDTQLGLGTLRFPFSAEALANLPKLKFQ